MDIQNSFRRCPVWPSWTLGELITDMENRRDDDAVFGDEIVEVQADQVFQVRDTRSLQLVLTFKNLSYNIKTGWKMTIPNCFDHATLATHSTKTLLSNISGEARDGEILAVLGDSGSGKSTLIDALANRIAKGSIKGYMTLNGEALNSNLLRTISTYVMQDDLLFPMLTVEETLMFSAEFRLPRSLSKSKKKARVQALIDQLGLHAAAKTLIGDEGHRGVSGGERRRVSIGTDIIHDPILLFLDEPTSGLDSSSAFMVVKVLKKIAQSRSIVVMSIHQPSQRIIRLLDGLIILSHGQAVYNGSPASLPHFFADFGHPVPENENLLEFSLDLIKELRCCPGGTTSLVEFNVLWQQNTKHACDNLDFSHLSLKDAATTHLAREKLVSGSTNDSSPTSTVSKFANPFWVEIAVLSRRSFLNSKRIPKQFGMRLGASLATGFILATMFKQLDESPRGVQERFGFFSFTMTSVFFTCGATLPVFHQERYIFMRETAYNAYRRSSYVLAHSLMSVPPIIIISAALAGSTFWSVGLAGGFPGFLFYYLTILVSFWAGSSFVTLIAAVVTNSMVANMIVASLLAYYLLVCGFFINRDRIPAYWIWLHYTSLVKYPYEAALQNEFLDPMKCFVKGVQVFDDTPLATVPAATKVELLKTIGHALRKNITSDTCITTGVDILKQQAITKLSKWNCLWVTVAWGFFFRILFYFALLFGSKNKRK